MRDQGQPEAPFEVTLTMRAVPEQLLAGVLVCSCVFIATLSVYGQKNENRPDEIGHRTVPHKSIISPEKEREFGAREADQFERSVQLVQDSVVDRYVTTLADNLIRNSDWKGPVAIKVVKSPTIESLSLPGGFIYVTSGLLLAADNDDQIAGAIAHEIAHAPTRHWASQMTRMTISQYAMAALVCVPTARPCSEFPNQGSEAVPLAFLKLAREDELEADYVGLQYVYKAGYDPNAYVVFLRKLAPKDAASRGLPDVFLAVPPVSQRIAKAEEQIRQMRNASSQPKLSPEFVLMKSRL